MKLRFILTLLTFVTFLRAPLAQVIDADSTVFAPAVASTVTPQIVQHYSTTPNPVGFGIPNGNAYQINIVPTLSGDTLIVTAMGRTGSALTLTDSAGDTSPTAICSANNGSGQGLAYIWAFQPATGTTWVKLTAGGTFAQPFDWNLTEVNNISSVADQGHNCQMNLTAASNVITPSAFTPTNNDSTGGNLIYNYTALDTGANGMACNADSYTPASTYTLLWGDMSFDLNGPGFGFPKATQYKVQTTAASTTTSLTIGGQNCSGGSGDNFASFSIALKIGAAGTAKPSTIHVDKVARINTPTQGSPTKPNSYTIPTPTTGNLRVMYFENPASNNGYANQNTTITSSDSCNYTRVIGTTSEVMLFYAQNCTACSTCTATFTNTGGGAMDLTVGMFYDISNAAASSYQNNNDASKGCNSVATIANDPSFTPSISTGLTIAALNNGQGPTKATTSPSGSYYVCPVWTGQNDQDTMCSGDGESLYFFTSNAAQNWTWTITSRASNTCSGMAAAFQ